MISSNMANTHRKLLSFCSFISFCLHFTATASGIALLHEFAGGTADGRNPAAAVTIVGSQLFGTTRTGGSNGAGTVFALNTDGSNYQVLRHFPGSVEGGLPAGGVLFSGSTLFGTTERGGRDSLFAGTIYAMNIDGSNYDIRHRFQGFIADSFTNDGAFPNGDMILDGFILYGTTGIGRAGNVYSFDTQRNISRSLHLFESNQSSAPHGPLAISGSILYGVAGGGTSDMGIVFSMATNGSAFRILHNFSNVDGRHLEAGLLLDNATLFGTTVSGGAHAAGVIFSIGVDGSNFQVLHNFGHGNDGAGPRSGLTLAGSKLYGATASGGKGGRGTIFSIDTNGSGYNLVHEFIGGTDDGDRPSATLKLVGSRLFGTTLYGGDHNHGTVFSITIPEPSTLLLAALTVAPIIMRRRQRAR